MITLSAKIRRAIRIVVIVIVGLILAFPLIYLVFGSVMSNAQLTSFPPRSSRTVSISGITPRPGIT